MMCPGLGQIASGRWLAGIIQLSIFLAAVGLVFYTVLSQLIPIYSSALNLVDDPGTELSQPKLASFILIIPGMIVAVLATIWSIWDAGRKPRVNRRP